MNLTRHSPSNASQAYGLQTPNDALPSNDDRLRRPKDRLRKTAFGRHSPSNASQAYGLQTPSDALPSNDDRLRPVFPEQRIVGLRPAYPKRRISDLRPVFY